ncbi:MAG: hypothetical protein ABIP97_00050 [Chthoniobacterales bacterium]
MKAKLKGAVKNPFPKDADRKAIWELLIPRDFEAFLAKDWSIGAADFLEKEFMGYDACGISNPDHWRLRYATLKDYREEWLRQAKEFQAVELKAVGKMEFLCKTITLKDIEVQGNRAVAKMKANGSVETLNHGPLTMKWQSIFFLKKVQRHWKITSFVSYLPNPMGKSK